MFAAMSATAAARVATTATAVTDRPMRMTAATAMADRRMGMTAMNERCVGMTAVNDRCTRMAAVNGCCVGMTATATAGVSAVPAVTTAPADAVNAVLVAPVPARAVPTVVVPAIIMTEPDKRCALDDIQAVSRVANCCGRDHRGCADAYHRCAGNEYGCGCNANGKSLHDDLPAFERIL